MDAAKKIDKSTWGDGPWQSEPDRLEFEHLGFPCIVQRVASGAFCGYVAMPPGHRWHGKRDGDRALEDIHVHGGITYAAACFNRICHVPKPGEPDDVWWLGFDHNHFNDMAPGDEALLKKYRDGRPPMGEYRTFQYAREGCESLARQAAKAAT